jgi:hypothetical protein
MSELPSGHVSFLPAFTGDGYNYGGGIIVTWGTVSVNLGGVDPMRGTYANERLAHVIAAAPDLKAVVEDMLAGLAYLRKHETIPYGFGIDRLEQAGRAALAKAKGATDAQA